MADRHSHPSLYAGCLAAMAVSGGVYPCDTLAPDLQAECDLPPASADLSAQDHHAYAPRRTDDDPSGEEGAA